MNETLYKAATLVLPMVFAIVFHEVAHGWVARALGDPTAAEQKRLSLNPLRHVDLFGTIILPGFLAILSAPILGWAKPVPVDERRLRNPRYGMMVVAAAGPVSNLIMAGLAAAALALVIPAAGDLTPLDPAMRFLVDNLINFVLINVFLAVFNLLPVPPLDGSKIVEGLLPWRARMLWRAFGRHGMLILMLLIIVLPSFIPGFNPLGAVVRPPAEWLIGWYFDFASTLAGR